MAAFPKAEAEGPPIGRIPVPGYSPDRLKARGQARAMLAALDLRNANSVFQTCALGVRHDLEDRAIPHLQRAVERHPRDARLWQLLGLAHRKLWQHGMAIPAFEAALARERNALNAHSLARARLEAGLNAVDQFMTARAIAPNDGSIALGLAAARLSTGDGATALAELDSLLAAQPQWIEGHGTACRLRWLLGDRETFTASLERALVMQPKALPLWQNLAILLTDAQRWDAAGDALARAERAAGPSPLLTAQRAVLAGESGDVRTADALFAQMGDQVDVTLIVRWLRHLLRSGQADTAAALAERRIADDAGHRIWPYLSLAWRLTGDGRHQWLEGGTQFVRVYDLGPAIGDLPALASCLRAIHQRQQAPLDQTLRGGTQTDGPLLARLEPEIARMRAAVTAAVEDYARMLPAPDPAHPLLCNTVRGPVRFAGSWSVRLEGGGFHVNHVHPAGWISSALYVALPEAEQGTDPKAGWLTLGEATELGLGLPPLMEVEPRPGRLALFPSTMWHGTRPFPAGERMTAAFDIARPLP